MEQHMEHLEEASSAEFPAFSSTSENVNNRKQNRQERRNGTPWTEDEHRFFLMGLLKYGKGDWRNISRNFVITRTPTQVASHAQKYYIRQLSKGKEKIKPSIHDTPTANHTDAAPLNSCNFHHIRSLL